MDPGRKCAAAVSDEAISCLTDDARGRMPIRARSCFPRAGITWPGASWKNFRASVWLPFSLSHGLCNAPALPRVDAPVAGTEGEKLEKSACHGNVLQKMDHLVQVGEVPVPHQRGGDAPRGQHDPD